MSATHDDHPTTSEADEHSDLDELRAENERLRTENAELREQRRQAGRGAIAAGGFAARVFTGRELTKATRAWLKASSGIRRD